MQEEEPGACTAGRPPERACFGDLGTLPGPQKTDETLRLAAFLGALGTLQGLASVTVHKGATSSAARLGPACWAVGCGRGESGSRK